MKNRLHSVVAALAVVKRHVRREFLRGPLGLPFVLPHLRLVQALSMNPAQSRSLWNGLADLGIPVRMRKPLFRALYVAPFGPADAAAPHRVARRHRELAHRLRLALAT